MKHLDIIRSRGIAYRKDHPAYVRRDDVPMIDLTKRLPTRQDSLSPVEKEATTLADDVLGALVLTVLGLAALYLLFGCSL